MNLVGRVAAALALLLGFAACGPAGQSSVIPASLAPPPAIELPPPSAAPFPGSLWTVNGRPAPVGSMTLIPGPAHCGWESATFLTIGWPLGRVPQTSDESRQYIRDPDHLFADRMLAPFIPSASLPEEAFDTGYRHGLDELWVDKASVDQLVYLVRGDVVEQWTRPRELIGCA